MNLKKSIIFSLSLVLFLTHLGLVFSVDYCLGEIASIKTMYRIEKLSKSFCCTTDLSDKKCCDETVITLNDQTDKLAVKIFSFNINFFHYFQKVEFFSFCPDLFNKIVFFYSNYFCALHDPPLFKLFCQFKFCV